MTKNEEFLRLFGARLNYARRRKGMRQSELAARIFISKSTISDWERGQRPPTIDLVMRVCEVLDTSIDFLVYGKENNNG